MRVVIVLLLILAATHAGPAGASYHASQPAPVPPPTAFAAPLQPEAPTPPEVPPPVPGPTSAPATAPAGTDRPGAEPADPDCHGFPSVPPPPPAPPAPPAAPRVPAPPVPPPASHPSWQRSGNAWESYTESQYIVARDDGSWASSSGAEAWDVSATRWSYTSGAEHWEATYAPGGGSYARWTYTSGSEHWEFGSGGWTYTSGAEHWSVSGSGASARWTYVSGMHAWEAGPHGWTYASGTQHWEYRGGNWTYSSGTEHWEHRGTRWLYIDVNGWLEWHDGAECAYGRGAWWSERDASHGARARDAARDEQARAQAAPSDAERARRAGVFATAQARADGAVEGPYASARVDAASGALRDVAADGVVFLAEVRVEGLAGATAEGAWSTTLAQGAASLSLRQAPYAPLDARAADATISVRFAPGVTSDLAGRTVRVNASGASAILLLAGEGRLAMRENGFDWTVAAGGLAFRAPTDDMPAPLETHAAALARGLLGAEVGVIASAEGALADVRDYNVQVEALAATPGEVAFAVESDAHEPRALVVRTDLASLGASGAADVDVRVDGEPVQLVATAQEILAERPEATTRAHVAVEGERVDVTLRLAGFSRHDVAIVGPGVAPPAASEEQQDASASPPPPTPGPTPGGAALSAPPATSAPPRTFDPSDPFGDGLPMDDEAVAAAPTDETPAAGAGALLLVVALLALARSRRRA